MQIPATLARTRARPRAEVWAPYLLFAVAAAAGAQRLFAGSFGDEGDNLAVGRLIAEGQALYRDIFSHHLPLAYYWSAGVIWLFGPSITALRVALLACQLGALALAGWASRLPAPAGLAALAWSLLNIFYAGNLVLYNTFSGLSLALLFFITYAATVQPGPLARRALVALAGAAAAALLSDPLNLPPIGVALCFLLAARVPARQLLAAAAGVGLVLGGYAAGLAASGSLAAFYADVVTFNLAVYSKYYHLQASLPGLIRLAARGLYIFEPRGWMGPDALAPLFDYRAADRWLLAGMLYRALVILSALALLLRGQPRAGLFVYLFAATLLLRSEVYLRAIPFVLIALCAASVLIAPQERPDPRAPDRLWPARAAIARAAQIAAALGLAAALLRGAGLVLANRAAIGYQASFAGYELERDHLRRLACGRDAALGYYPGSPYMYFFTGMRPVARYVLLWPWVAEVGQGEIIQALAGSQPALVYLDSEGQIWGRPNQGYLRPTWRYLAAHYTKVEHNYYQSPALARACPTP